MSSQWKEKHRDDYPIEENTDNDDLDTTIINVDGSDFTVSNVMIRYFDSVGLSRARIAEEKATIEREIEDKNLIEFYAHIEVVPSDTNRIQISKLWKKI